MLDRRTANAKMASSSFVRPWSSGNHQLPLRRSSVSFFPGPHSNSSPDSQHQQPKLSHSHYRRNNDNNDDNNLKVVSGSRSRRSSKDGSEAGSKTSDVYLAQEMKRSESFSRGLTRVDSKGQVVPLGSVRKPLPCLLACLLTCLLA